jgi:HlyD family secretion protein
MTRRSIFIFSVLVLLALGGGYVWWADPFASPPAYRTAKIERGSITAAVASTGTLNPVVSVQVGSQVSGQVKELFVDYNSAVKKHQLIARIDPQSFSLRVNQAMADVDAARATALTTRSNLAALQAEVARAKVLLADAEREYQRNQMLFDKGFVSAAIRDKARATLDAAREQLNAEQAQVGVGHAQVRNADAIVKQREAQLAQARVDLDRTEIRAPVDGTVVKKSVEPGQTVAASLQAPELFVIAQDLHEMQVDASIDESEVGRVRVGQRASFTVDSFPGRTFRGEVAQVRKAAQVVQNVVTYIAVIRTSNPDLGLFPGMTANVRIIVNTRENVLKVPNAALRFRPVGATDAAAGPAESADKAKSKGKGQALIERLQKELALTPDQRSRIEAIMRETRGKIEALSGDDAAGGKRQIERARSDSRARIAEVLTAEQRVRYQEMVGAARGRGARATSGRAWVRIEEGQVKPVSLRLGLTDGTSTEIVSGDLKEGDEVIVGTLSEGPKTKPQAASKSKGPRFGF